MMRLVTRLAERLLPSALFALSLFPLPATADTVANPDAPAEGLVQADLDELFTLGGYSEADEEFFGVVANAIVDEAGNTYLLDEQLCEVRVFDADGNYVRSFGREGEGPGEFRSARDMLLLPDGQVGVIYGQQSRLAMFGLDGTIGEDRALMPEGTRFSFLMGAQSRGGRVVLQQHASTINGSEMTSTGSMVALDADLNLTHTYSEHSRTQKLDGPNISISISSDDFSNAWVLLDDGSLAVNESPEEYRIDILGPDGEALRTITRDYEPLRRSDEEMDRLRRERRERHEAGRGDDDPDDIDPFYDVILSMHVGPDGQLWVMTGRGRFGEGVPEDTLGTFDVFDAEGRFVRQVSIDVPFLGGSDEFEFIDDRLFLYEESRDARTSMYAGYGMEIQTDQETDGEIEPLTIWCWRITLPSS